MKKTSTDPVTHAGTRVAHSAVIVGAMTGISRLAGLVREQLMAVMFGTGVFKSAFDVAFRIPNLFRRLFGEGALSAAVIPVYTEVLAKEGQETANRLVAHIAGLLVAVLGALVAAGILFTWWLQALISPDSRWAKILPLLRIMLPYAPLICLAALVMGILNSHKRFAMPALAPVFLNLIWIGALALICPFVTDDLGLRIRIVAWAVIVSGVVQIAVQLPLLHRHGIALKFGFQWRADSSVKRVLQLMLPMALGAGLIQINVFVDGLLAMWVAPWGPAAMEYAERLVYLPMGLVGNAFATVLLPAFSSHAAGSDAAVGISTTLERALRNIAVIMAPMAVGLTILALPIVNLIYCWKNGRFDAESARFTARALAGYAPGLLVFSFQKAVTPVFYALQDTYTPMRISIIGVVLNFCLNVLFVLTWKEEWQHMGIAVATVITSVINSAMLAWILYRRLGTPRFSGIAATYIRSMAAALLMGLVAFWINGRVMALGAADSKMWQLLALGAAIAGGAILYIVLATIFCRSAVRELVGDLRHRKKVKRGK